MLDIKDTAGLLFTATALSYRYDVEGPHQSADIRGISLLQWRRKHKPPCRLSLLLSVLLDPVSTDIAIKPSNDALLIDTLDYQPAGYYRSPFGGAVGSKESVTHLGFTRAAAQGARYALLPGDPFRSETIARAVAGNGTAPVQLAWQREFCTWRVEVDGVFALVTSTGIGGPSAAIAIDELAQLGVDTFIRVGTTGAIQPDIKVGDVIITSGSVRLDGASTHYAPIEFPAVAHHQVMAALVAAAEESLPGRFHVGVTVSSDTFYPGQERVDSFSGRVPRRFAGATDEWRALHCLNYEMESATVLAVAAALGLRAGCVTGVVVNRAEGERLVGIKEGEASAVELAVAGLRRLIADDNRRGWK